MAIYHLNAKTIGRSQGRSATGAAAYRAGVRIEDARTGLVFDYRRKRGVDGSEILTPDGSTPDRSALWNIVEQIEKRTDAQLAREIEIALPRELTPEQMRDCVRGFVREQFTSAGMIADIAFHNLTRSNPHAHILLTLREQQGEGFGLKRREWNDRQLCVQWRESWAHHANAALGKAGHAARVDHRTLIEQAADAARAGHHIAAIALDRVPTIHERGSPAAQTHNEKVRQANAARLAAWQSIEKATNDEGRVMVPATKPPRSTAENLAAEDLAFAKSMRERTDRTASHWQSYDEQAQEIAAWLHAKVGGDARRLGARDRAAIALQAARIRRDDWMEANPRPRWMFWKRRRWKKQKDAEQSRVEAAKRAATKASERASPKEITTWRTAYADRQAERAAAIAARRALALTPSEQARAAMVRERDEIAARATVARAASPRVVIEQAHIAKPSRPRPGRR